MILEIFLSVGKSLGDIVAQLQLDRVGTDHEGPAEIRFPLFKYRAQIQKKDVVFSDHQIRRIFIVRSKCIAPGANDALVPVGGNPTHPLGQVVDVLVDLAFQYVTANHSLASCCAPNNAVARIASTFCIASDYHKPGTTRITWAAVLRSHSFPATSGML